MASNFNLLMIFLFLYGRILNLELASWRSVNTLTEDLVKMLNELLFLEVVFLYHLSSCSIGLVTDILTMD